MIQPRRAPRPALLVLLALLAAPALAQDAVVTPGATLSAPPTEWLGDTPHLVLMGTLNGHPLDIQYLDVAAAEGVAGFAGKREYLPGDAGDDGAWRYGDFEVALQAVIAGVERSIEMEFENRDFAAHALPATFELGAENFPDGARAFLEAQAEWESAAGAVNDEVGGWTGTLTLALDEGNADGEGLVPDGLIGGHLVAESGSDRLVMSFTVPVSEYEKDD